MKILVISPHPDDAEIGMGATIAKSSFNGNEVYIIDLTNGEPTPFGTVKKRLSEAKKAYKILKLKERIILDFPNRFLEDKIEYRKKIAEHIRRIRPDILFIPYNFDAHPDHIAAYYLGIGARFYSKLTKSDIKGEPFFTQKVFFYFSSHFKLSINPSFIFPIDKKFFLKKIKAIKVYKSQFSYKPNNRVIETIIENGKYWGNLVNSDFGEPFISPEPIPIKNLQWLI